MSFKMHILFVLCVKSAHMHIMEAVMMLYAKEVVTPNRVMAAIQRLNHVPHRNTITMPEDSEKAILLWVNRIVEALKHRISSSPVVGFISILTRI